ncbi:unnamed protein product [Meganyctiphanes norvegica]|uniref:Ankyrin repeat domain-containing protein n=1 Tax=Meganyctiphanes norvegica TaxID=48144 RepID=A0AAV2QFN9_MEGNR
MATDKANKDLLAAVEGSDPAGVRAALARGASPNTTAGGLFDYPVLIWAVMKQSWSASDLEIFNVVLGQPGINVNQRGRYATGRGWSALMVAARRGYTEACTALLKGGADPHLTSHRGCNAIWQAAWAGHRQAIEAIISWGGDPKKKDNSGESPAEAARRQGHEDLASWLSIQEQLPPHHVGQEQEQLPPLL